jgi:hypothetical protein
LTKDGKVVAEYDDFGRISGLAIDRNDTIYRPTRSPRKGSHPGWLKGVRIGSLKDGKVTVFIPPHKTDAAKAPWAKASLSTRREIFTPLKRR